ncbi:MAG: hydrogenase maturation nickel metallochaperone HypA, partial [Lachnospiraceae bacterium]|nr:hydrogenase maturation nickel metallochaperone HypA [Lachnospiraceae bacterium]
MHELGVVFHIVKSVKRIAKENNLSEIASVTVEVG